MLRLLAMLAAFVTLAVVVAVAVTTWTFGEVVDITSHQTRYKSSEYTRCEAVIEYDVAGKRYRNSDVAEIKGHHPTSACPFEVGQRAVIIYPADHPATGSAYTSSGDGWMYLLLAMFGLPLAGMAQISRARQYAR